MPQPRKPSLSELAERYLTEEASVPDEALRELEQDPRKGAQRLAKQIQARRAANRAEGQRLRQLLRFETELRAQGYQRVAGVDEAGMAPLAGPVIAAAVILPEGFRPRGIDDSKVLDERTRDELAGLIKAEALSWAVGRAGPEEIDQINIYHAGLLAMRRAIEGLAPAPDYVLIDARTVKEVPIPQRGIIHGDALSLTIAAASIIAKTTRDGLMKELDLRYPGYGFARHKGYPVPEHFAALRSKGPCPIHRRSFAPVREVLGLVPRQGELALSASAATQAATSAPADRE